MSIRLLGTPEIQVAGAPLTLNHLKARALLFYLAATGQPHTREYLATLLWSESTSSDAHHSLRSALYHLRQALRPMAGDIALVSDGELLCLQADTYTCDVLAFRRFLTEGNEHALTRAVALYRGSLLQGFTLPNAPAFEEWVQAECSRLSQMCFDALDRLAAWSESRQAGAEAIGYVQQMIQIDPLAETAQQRLLRLYLRQNEGGLALHQYRQFEKRLQQELNISPSSETQALFHDALRQQRGPAFRNVISSSFSARQLHILPFVGREPLLQQLTSITKDVQAGHGMTVLLQGEGGIGKSRLLEELASNLIVGSPPWLVLKGSCSPFDDLLSHGPFLEALQSAVPGDQTDLLVESDKGVPDARGRFFWRVLQTIQSLAGSTPLLLIIDDLQWANSSALNLFGFVSMRIHHLPVLLAGTVQHAEAIPSLQRLITLQRRRGELHLFALSPLTQEDIMHLLHASGLKTTSVETFAEWLHARSTGSPFLLNEILAQQRTEGILRPDGNGWQLDTIRWLRWRTTFTLPETTHDLVSWRLADLPSDALYLLDVLAVAGQPLPAKVLCEFHSIQADTFLTHVEDLASRGLIVELSSGMLALPHHLLRETLLHRLSNLRRRSIYQQLAVILEEHATPLANASLRQIALYAVAGEDVNRAQRYGLRVLADLPQEYTGAETVDFVQHLYDLLAPTASVDEMIRLTRALGTLHQSLGHLENASHWHQQNLGWAQKGENTAAQAGAYFEMSELALMSNDYHAATRTAQEGLSIVHDEDATFHSLIGRGHRLLGAALAMEGNHLTAAENHLREAVVAHRQTRNQSELCAALFELGNIAAQRGELRRALDFYDESARTAEAGRVHYYHALACNNFAYHSLLLGQIGAAQQSVAQGVKVAENYDLLAALLHLYSTQGEIHLYLAEWKQAEESFRRGFVLAEDLGSIERQAGYRGGLALAARGRNDLLAGIRLIEEALALIADQGYLHLRTRLQIWLAEMLYEQKHFVEAARHLEAALEVARNHNRTLLLVQGERLRARLLASKGHWLAAKALFARTIDKASSLGLPLEIARVQAIWGETALNHSPTADEGRALIASARDILLAHNARADLATLP